jgi:hypothetical protein
MRTYGGVEVYTYAFLTLALNGVSGKRHFPPLYPGEGAPSTHRIGGSVGPRGNLDIIEKRKVSFPCRVSNSGRPARSVITLPTELSRLPRS